MKRTLLLTGSISLAFLFAAAGGCANVLDIPSERRLALSDAGTDGADKDTGTPTCTGEVFVKLIVDIDGPTPAVSVPYLKGEIDYFREINELGGIYGCPVNYEYGNGKYDPAVVSTLLDTWKAQPEWHDVVAIMALGTPETTTITTGVAGEAKLVISASYLASLATPKRVNTPVDVPEVNINFDEFETPLTLESVGYPYNFFAGTDYSSAARIAMYYIKSAGGKRVGFFRSSNPYGTGPMPAARTFAKEQNLQIGRDLVLEHTDDLAKYKALIFDYFDGEVKHHQAENAYEMVDWVWGGNTSKTSAYMAIAIAEAKAKLTELPNVQLIVNNWGFDETFYALCELACPGCGEKCKGISHGVMPFLAFGDMSTGSSEMAKVQKLRQKWLDTDAALPPDSAVPSNNVRYVQGYVTAMVFVEAAKLVVEGGQPVTGSTVKAALETFNNFSTGGLSAALNFSDSDHRPQSAETIYRVTGPGKIERLRDVNIALKPEWLGW